MPVTVEFVTPVDLRDILRGMAVVSLLRSRYADHEFRFDALTDTVTAVWHDFAGNRAHFLFVPAGSVILGFDHESPMSPHATCTGPHDFRAWPGVYESLPSGLMEAVRMNPFGPDWDVREVTFCLWNQTPGRVWTKGDIEYPDRDHGDSDGQGYILSCVRKYYLDLAAEFRERYRWELDEGAVAELLSGDEIKADCLRRLAPGCDVGAARSALEAMGFRIT